MTTQGLIRIAWVLASVAATSMSTACGGDSPSTPLSPDIIRTVSSPSPNALSVELTGVAIGDDGRPVPNAPVSVNFQPASGGHFIVCREEPTRRAGTE